MRAARTGRGGRDYGTETRTGEVTRLPTDEPKQDRRHRRLPPLPDDGPAPQNPYQEIVDEARVELLLTTGWCPFAANLIGMISERVNSLPGVAGSSVEIVWDEPWTTDRLSDDARRKLRFLPHPNALQRPQGGQP